MVYPKIKVFCTERLGLEFQAELRKAASALAERLEIPQEHLSLETTHHLYAFWKFASPGTEYINIKSSFFAADMNLTIEL